MNPITLLTTFMPMITDGVRGLMSKFTEGAASAPLKVSAHAGGTANIFLSLPYVANRYIRIAL